MRLKEHASRFRREDLQPLRSTQPDGQRRITYLRHGTSRPVVGDSFMEFARETFRTIVGSYGPLAAPSTVVTFPGAAQQRPHADLGRAHTYSLILAHDERRIGFKHLTEPVLLRAGDALFFLAPLCHYGEALGVDATRASMSHVFLGSGILHYDLRPSTIVVHGCDHDGEDDDGCDVLADWQPIFTRINASSSSASVVGDLPNSK